MPISHDVLVLRSMNIFWFCSLAFSITICGLAILCAVWREVMSNVVIGGVVCMAMFVICIVFVYGAHRLSNHLFGWHLEIQALNERRATFFRQKISCIKLLLDFILNLVVLGYALKHPTSSHGAKHGCLLAFSWGLINIGSTFLGKMYAQTPVDGVSVLSSKFFAGISFFLTEKIWVVALILFVIYLGIGIAVTAYYHILERESIRIAAGDNYDLDMKGFYGVYGIVFGVCVGFLILGDVFIFGNNTEPASAPASAPT